MEHLNEVNIILFACTAVTMLFFIGLAIAVEIEEKRFKKS